MGIPPVSVWRCPHSAREFFTSTLVYVLVIPTLLVVLCLIVYDVRDVRRKLREKIEVRKSRRLSKMEMSTLRADINKFDLDDGFDAASSVASSVDGYTTNAVFDGGK